MTRKVAAYALFILGFITVTFFRRYSGTIIPYPILFWLAGLAMLVAGWALLRFTPLVKETQREAEMRAEIAALKLNGIPVPVSLSNCEVKDYSFVKEQERYGTEHFFTTLDIEREIQAWNALGDSTRNTERVEVHRSVVVYEHNHEGSTKRYFSLALPYDRATLMFKLDDQKAETLYIDRTDPARYYLDVEAAISL